MEILKVENVYKNLGRREIIKGINFNIKSGEIFGFLGPNGAGKTTTIRMLAGLISPNKGTIKICDYDIVRNKKAALSHVGAVVENPESYTYLSGRQNLNMIAEIRKIPKKTVDEIVDLVNLSDRINDKVKKYSLGMKQRLGLASALISKPELLILDEPTNGLDPSGILDFRAVIKQIVKETGASVFISSHILAEVEQLCTRAAFINHGEIKAVESLTAGESNNETDTLVLVTNTAQNVVKTLNSISLVKNVSQDEDNIFTVISVKDKSSEIVTELVSNNIGVCEIYKKHNSLEQRYMELVEGGRRVC